MTLPVLPDVETILANSAQVLREVILPDLSDEWPRNCARVIAGALDYAIGLLKEDRAAEYRAELEDALQGVSVEVQGSGSAFERASAALVWSREHDGPEADAVRAVLHPVLVAQMDREAAASEPLLTALHVAMRGTDNK